VIDLSYAAASKLDYRKTGVAEVLVEAIDASQWSPALEESIRKRRNNSGFSSPTSVTNTPADGAADPVIQTQPPSENEIRQQHKRVPGYYVQVAAVSKIGGALLLKNTLVQELRRSNVFVEQASDRADLFRVLIGPVLDANSAVVVMQKLASLGRGQGLMITP
jgi:cell division septation protein DedD